MAICNYNDINNNNKEHLMSACTFKRSASFSVTFFFFFFFKGVGMQGADYVSNIFETASVHDSLH